MQNVRAVRPCLASHLITVHAAHHALDRLPLLLLHSEIDPRNCTGWLNGASGGRNCGPDRAGTTKTKCADALPDGPCRTPWYSRVLSEHSGVP